MPGLLIIAALEREIAPLVKNWQRQTLSTGDTNLPVFRRDQLFAVCSGIGPIAARRAAQAAFAREHPDGVISTGFAGALETGLGVGTLIRPVSVVDAESGKSYETEPGSAETPARQGILVSASQVSGPENKKELAARFHARAVDMEAASVAEVAQQDGTSLVVLKVISDELDFPMPDFSRFTSAEGHLNQGELLRHAALHPGTWPVLSRLARNTRRASLQLCRELSHLIDQQTFTNQRGLEPRMAPRTARELKSH